jgi:hypothetical protein
MVCEVMHDDDCLVIDDQAAVQKTMEEIRKHFEIKMSQEMNEYYS